jgi:hypothetical protein
VFVNEIFGYKISIKFINRSLLKERPSKWLYDLIRHFIIELPITLSDIPDKNITLNYRRH